MLKKDILKAIYMAIDDINDQLPEESQLDKTEESFIFGNRGKLDSMGLVHLIVATEQNIEDLLNVSITLADEKAMSQMRNPFKTVGTLAESIINAIGND